MSVGDRVAVTGATGFVAKHCIAELLKKGYRVRGTLRRPEVAPEVVAAVSKLVDPAGKLEFATLDLMSDAGWDDALRDCKFLMHVASPYPRTVSWDRDAVIRPARDGTLRALAAAGRNRVERTVLTSSTLAVLSGHSRPTKETYSEEDWSDADSPSILPYPLSKTLAERAAWDFIARDTSGMKLAVVCPAFIFGPALDRDIGTSAETILLMLKGKYPAMPHCGVAVSDVCDVAAMHVAAMETPAAAGQRFLCASGSLWAIDIARILAANFPAFRRKLPTRELPDFMVRIASIFDSSLKYALPELGVLRKVSTEKAKTMLHFRFRSVEDAVVGMARSLIDLGLVTPPAQK